MRTFRVVGRCLVIALAFVALVSGRPVVSGQAPTQPTELDVVLFAKNVMVPMRDGVHLATDIYRPALNGEPVQGKLPLLLQRTPYNKEGGQLIQQAKALASHGYVVALQDDRGTYHSEGVQIKYIGYGKDGYDAVEFLAQLPYTDGQIGMWGTSYAGHTQASAAIAHPPHLKTVVINCGGLNNGWEYKIRNHGAFELAQQVGWAFGQLAAQTNNMVAHDAFQHEKAVDWIGDLHGKRGQNPLSLAQNFEDYIFDIMTRSDYDQYWRQPDVNWSVAFEQTSDIPMLHISGWYDSYPSGTIKNYIGLSKLKKSPVRLLVGPWTHGGNTRSFSGDVEFGPDAAINDFATGFHLRWFDHFLKGKTTLVAAEPSVRLFVMGTGDGHKDQNGRLYHGGYWRTADTWPPPSARSVSFYLHANGTLGGDLPAADDRPSTYTYDPTHPVPTIGGSFSPERGLVGPGGFDQREREFKGDENKGFYGSRPPYLPLRARSDVLVFETKPLEQDLEVIGPVEVALFAGSTAVDTDFTAKIVDVYPPSKDYPVGYDLNITDGVIRARYRDSPDKQEFMKPGEVYKFKIEPMPTANVFKKGHRIRLDISSSNFPRFDINPNSGEPLGKDRRTVVADNTVYHDARRPSQLMLSVVDRTTTTVSGK
jgi:putative CocE/NonD family hydrolase